MDDIVFETFLVGAPSFLISLTIALIILFFGHIIIHKLLHFLDQFEKLTLSYLVYLVIVYCGSLINPLINGEFYQKSYIIIFTMILVVMFYVFKNALKINLNKIYNTLIINKNLLFILIAALLIYSLPILMNSEGIIWIEGDMRRHIAGINQFIIGRYDIESAYQDPLPGYPWLFHASIALIASFFKSLDIPQMNAVFFAYNTIGIITIIWGFFSINLLSRLFFKNRKKQFIMTIFGLLSGGLGYLFYKGENVLIEGTLGDMRIGYPYNGALIFITPAWPRHFGYVVFILSIYMITKTLEKWNYPEQKKWIVLSGVTLGFCGFIHPIPFIISGFVLGFFFVIKLMDHQLRSDIILIGIISLLILSPYIITYILSNFKENTIRLITYMEPQDIPFIQYFTAIGLVFVFAIIGIIKIIIFKNKIEIEIKKDIIAIYSFIFIILIIISIFNSTYNLNLELNGKYFFRQHKMWYLFYPILLLYAVEGITWSIEKMNKIVEKLIIVQNKTIKGSYKIESDKKAVLPATFFILIILIIGIGSPLLTSYVLGKSVSDNILVKQFTETGEDNLIYILNLMVDQNDVFASPSNKVSLTNNIVAFTGLKTVYYYDYRIDYDNNLHLQLEQKIRKTDVDLLFSNQENETIKLDIINKYNITYIISKNKMINLPEIFLKTERIMYFLNRKYYLYFIN